MEHQEINQQLENLDVKNEESSDLSWYVFTGCMLIGIGIGMAFGRTETGVLVGIGVGFIAYAILKYKKK